jgi:hypothetical protein
MNLGEFIANETPYGKMTSLDVDPATVVRSGIGKARNSLGPFPEGNRVRNPGEAEYWQGFFWTIGVEGQQDNVPQTKTVRVSKALRIPYEVNGVRYNLIVGFEGAGGP